MKLANVEIMSVIADAAKALESLLPAKIEYDFDMLTLGGQPKRFNDPAALNRKDALLSSINKITNSAIAEIVRLALLESNSCSDNIAIELDSDWWRLDDTDFVSPIARAASKPDRTVVDYIGLVLADADIIGPRDLEASLGIGVEVTVRPTLYCEPRFHWQKMSTDRRYADSFCLPEESYKSKQEAEIDLFRLNPEVLDMRRDPASTSIGLCIYERIGATGEAAASSKVCVNSIADAVSHYSFVGTGHQLILKEHTRIKGEAIISLGAPKLIIDSGDH